MMLTAAWAWLGIGLWVIPDPSFRKRLSLLQRRGARPLARLLGAFALAAMVGAAHQQLGVRPLLTVPLATVVAMSALTAAQFAAALWPRVYLASVVGSALAVAGCLLGRGLLSFGV